MNPTRTPSSPIQFVFIRSQGKVIDCRTSSPALNHFLDVMKLSRAYNTWLSYAYDLKIFFTVVPKAPETIDRRDCLAFIQHQQQAGRSEATINRRLAAVSSLFHELQLVDGERFAPNPIQPARGAPGQRVRSQSLYRRQPQRVPDTLSSEALQQFLNALPTWRDRTLVLLMWLSCLRISEALALRFEDIECSRRRLRLPTAKGALARQVFMDRFTFMALNRYLDEERQHLFPDEPAVFVAFKGKARGRPLSVNAFQKLLRYYAQKCDLPDLHAHLFRHTGITQLVQHKMPEPAIRKFVGHRHPDSLAPYLHLADDFVQAEFEQAQAALQTLPALLGLAPGGDP